MSETGEVKDLPIATSVWHGTIHIFGVDLHVHVLDTGQRVVEADSVAAFIQALESNDAVEFEVTNSLSSYMVGGYRNECNSVDVGDHRRGGGLVVDGTVPYAALAAGVTAADHAGPHHGLGLAMPSYRMNVVIEYDAKREDSGDVAAEIFRLAELIPGTRVTQDTDAEEIMRFKGDDRE